jgi:hypothetical protein
MPPSNNSSITLHIKIRVIYVKEDRTQRHTN